MSRSSRRPGQLLLLLARYCSPAPVSLLRARPLRGGLFDHRSSARHRGAGRTSRETTCDGRRAASTDRDLQRPPSRSTRRRTRKSRRTSPTSRQGFSPRKRSSCSTAASSRRTTGFRAYASRASTVVPADGERRYVAAARAGSGNRSQSAVTGTVKLQLEGVQDGQMTSLDTADLVPDKASYDMAYEFRYFQGLECGIDCRWDSSRDALPCRHRAERPSRGESPAELRMVGCHGMKKREFADGSVRSRAVRPRSERWSEPRLGSTATSSSPVAATSMGTSRATCGLGTRRRSQHQRAWLRRGVGRRAARAAEWHGKRRRAGDRARRARA